jgi:hypothetical protein
MSPQPTSRHLVPRLCATAILLGTTGCAQLPPDHSPHYSYVAVPSPYRPDRPHYVLAPDACLVSDPTDQGYFGPRLPPGCANAHNLQQMAERERDLVHGRRLGAAPAGPSVRAAQQYLNGGEGPLGAGVVRPGISAPAAAPSVEPQRPRKD